MKMKFLLISMVVGSLHVNANGKEVGNMKGSITNAIQLKKEDKSVTPLFSGSFKVMGIGLSKGQKLEKHQTPTSAFLFVQSGHVLFKMGKESTVLQAGDYFAIPATQMHEVEAVEDSRLMLMK